MADVKREIQQITNRLIERSKPTRSAYLARIEDAAVKGPHRAGLGCSNLAHGFAACGPNDKEKLAGETTPNLAIITAYNDMLSAHQPFERFPAIIKKAAMEAGATAQVASGVPAMCDGVTQGETGMELSLFSRDVIAMSASIGLSHNMFDAAVFLGVCDKIIPGLFMAALSFGHLPCIFIPAGPMTSGQTNSEKARIRQLYAEGKIGRKELLASESAAYHGPGTCTFYGTANSNQMLMEIMGVHLPGSSFINPGDQMRDALTSEATKRALAITAMGNDYTPVGKVIDEKAVINGVIGLHATGGSTNHTIHLIAMAQMAGIKLTWEDISDLSDHVPLLTRIYPNGPSDVNHFHAAGGMSFLIRQLLDGGLIHEDVKTVWGTGLNGYLQEPKFAANGTLSWQDTSGENLDPKILRSAKDPFQKNGGLKMLSGNLGKAVTKISAVKEEHRIVEAPAVIFHEQHELMDAFKAGKLNRDFIAVMRFQGPRANGMPELHKLVPTLGVLQERGLKVALVTDGRMSGASGKVPAAIHVTPEAAVGGPIAQIKEGDMLRLDATKGTLAFLGDQEEFNARLPVTIDLSKNQFGMGRELFAGFRAMASSADHGASAFSGEEF